VNKHYLVIPRIDVQRANAMVTAGVISLCPVMPAVMMGEAFGHATGLFPEGLMLVHHDAYLLAEQGLDHTSRSRVEHYPHQFRGATVINGKDIAGGDKKTPSNSIQPTASMNGTWSVVMQFAADSADADTLLSACKQFFCRLARLAGGVITDYAAPLVEDDLPKAMRACRGGFVVVDRSAWLLSDEQTRIERLLAFADGSLQPEFEAPRRWLLPASLGYALLTEPEDTEGAREGYPHAFAETLLGLVELISLRHTSAFQHEGGLEVEDNPDRTITPAESCFWRYSWPENDIFTLTQKV